MIFSIKRCQIPKCKQRPFHRWLKTTKSRSNSLFQNYIQSHAADDSIIEDGRGRCFSKPITLDCTCTEEQNKSPGGTEHTKAPEKKYPKIKAAETVVVAEVTDESQIESALSEIPSECPKPITVSDGLQQTEIADISIKPKHLVVEDIPSFMPP